MNACMRQQGQMGGMRGGFMPSGSCQRVESCPQVCPVDTEEKYNIEEPIGMSYVPWQKWRDVVDGCRGLAQGTIFNELNLGFGCANKNCGASCSPSNLPPNYRAQNIVKCSQMCGQQGNRMQGAGWK